MMIRRPALIALLAIASACSQRSPWRVVGVAPAPATNVSTSPVTERSAPATAPATAKTTPDTARANRMNKLALSAVAAAPSTEAPMDATVVAHLKGMLFPVAGKKDSIRLDDSFDAPRDGGARKHNAIDIMAPRGTPVLAVSDGRILRLQKNPKGGLTLYATDLEDQFVYYYAHLNGYHPRIYSGKPLMRGDTLGFVGTTGNAPPNLPHLHFQVMRMPANRSFANGTPINPYPLLSASKNAEK